MHDGFYTTPMPEKHCKACMMALNTFAPEWRVAIAKVYMHPEGVQEGVRHVCMEKLIPNSAMWSLINQYERKAARLIIIEEV